MDRQPVSYRRGPAAYIVARLASRERVEDWREAALDVRLRYAARLRMLREEEDSR